MTGFSGGINSAILRYDTATEEDPATVQNLDATVLNEADLAPLSNPAAVRMT